jgi:hypothetical protein
VPESSATEFPAVENLSDSAFFDSFRRWSQAVRIIDRLQIVGYEVGANQRSVIYFEPRGESFSGIADAIASEPGDGSESNEWLLYPFFRPYSPHDTNAFGQPGFADWYDFFEPGQWMAPEVATDAPMLWHISHGARMATFGNMLSESLSGYNYAKLLSGRHVNDKSCSGDPSCEAEKLAFYKSRQIYRKPYDISKAESVTRDGKNLVKVTLTTRLQSTLGETGGAPTTIANDVDSWDGPTIASEPFRTDENALRSYLVWERTGYNPPPIPGDQALTSGVHTLVDSVFGAIMPTMLLVKLVPSPAAGSSTWHDPMALAELYIRAMCEGFVDKEFSATNSCTADITGCNDAGYDIADFTFESLCLQASAGAVSGFITLPTTATDYISEDECVADPWQSHGPLPATRYSAEVFNLYSDAVNLLTTTRVMLPYEIEMRVQRWIGGMTVPKSTLCDGGGGAVPCSTPSGYHVCSGSGPPATTVFSDSGWYTAAPSEPIEGTIGCAHDWLCDVDDYHLGSIRTASSFRFTGSADIINAIPSDWRDAFTGYNIGTMFCRQAYVKRQVMAGAGTRDCDGSGSVNFSCDIREQMTPAAQQYTCVFRTAGTLDPGEYAPGSIFAVAWPPFCAIGSEYAEVLTPVPGRTLVLEVPLA